MKRIEVKGQARSRHGTENSRLNVGESVLWR